MSQMLRIKFLTLGKRLILLAADFCMPRNSIAIKLECNSFTILVRINELFAHKSNRLRQNTYTKQNGQ